MAHSFKRKSGLAAKPSPFALAQQSQGQGTSAAHFQADLAQADLTTGTETALARHMQGDLKVELQGDSGSVSSLEALNRFLAEVKEQDVLPFLRQGMAYLKKGQWKEGGDEALKVLHINERHHTAWHMLAISRDKQGDFANALRCYEKALLIKPEALNIAKDLGRLAHRMNLMDLSVKFFQHVIARQPDDFEAINNLASSYREMNALDEAMELLKTVLGAHPEQALLWNTLGTIINTRGDIDTALIFYEEALRLDPKLYTAYSNRAMAALQQGRIDDALRDADMAATKLDDPIYRANAELGAAHISLAGGRIEDGWRRYLNRTIDGTAEKINTVMNRPKWKRGTPLAGKHIFVCGEQGLGDEIMFGTALPDLVRELGDESLLSLGVESRLVPMFKKAFPRAQVYAHRTVRHEAQVYRVFPDLPADHTVDEWMFMGELMGLYRTRLSAFPITGHLLSPDPERVAYWKAELAKLGPAPKVGLLWKSLIKHSARNRYYSPFEQWEDILRTEGLIFINLQYGDVSEEMAAAEAAGLKIWNPPGIDLKNDLDDLSALCQAVDVVLGPSNATSNIAAAAGTPIWILMAPYTWTALGQSYDYPWYPKARMFMTQSLMDWRPTLEDMRESLVAEWVGKPSVSS
jgi:tetratricopeptide (TPR) repeat protein